MIIFNDVLRFIDFNVIACLIPMFLILNLLSLCRKFNFNTSGAFQVIRWFVILYASILLISIIGELIANAQLGVDFFGNGYTIFYWILLVLFHLSLFTLLSKRLSRSKLYLLLMLIVINVVRFFETSFIYFTLILGTKFRDSQLYEWNLPNFLSRIFIQGLFLTILILIILKLISQYKKRI